MIGEEMVSARNDFNSRPGKMFPGSPADVGRVTIDVFTARNQKRVLVRHADTLKIPPPRGHAGPNQRNDLRLVGTHGQRHRRTKRKPSHDQGSPPPPSGLVHRHAKIILFAAPVIVLALRGADPAKIEPQNAVASSRERPRCAENHFEMHRPPLQRVRVSENGSPLRLPFRAFPQRFQ